MTKIRPFPERAKTTNSSVVSRPIKRGGLPALERNILKRRALEMVMILFYAEHLQTFVRESIRATDRIVEADSRLPKNTKDVNKKAFGILVQDGIITKAEKDEIKHLIDYRNEIAHEIHKLVYDLGQLQIHQDYRRFLGRRYRQEILSRIRYYLNKISESLSVGVLSFDELLFEPAEKAYEEELDRLDRKITRLAAKRRGVG